MGQIEKFVYSLIIILSLALVVTCNGIPICQTYMDCPSDMCTRPKHAYCVSYKCYCV
ncbi:putative Late nodulin [Medicago truncatula]|uniref:Nodule Cysteine-Rich (NCR) secreted peptide n=1 Tax=Medicago truncatula TaxID=3880 RepID=G7IQM1_MEDTR|nr:Nodule Cysteine-Rich (NCR) secreted peptide [Medicago truncatula]RHN74213.1 putative Late nodulin [Medicago truncatula]